MKSMKEAKMKLLAGTTPVREPDWYDAAIQEAIDNAVRSGHFVALGLNADGKMVYRRTTKDQ